MLNLPCDQQSKKLPAQFMALYINFIVYCYYSTEMWTSMPHQWNICLHHCSTHIRPWPL